MIGMPPGGECLGTRNSDSTFLAQRQEKSEIPAKGRRGITQPSIPLIYGISWAHAQNVHYQNQMLEYC